MKTIGLIGGMSWESSIEYYRIVNEVTRAKLGGLHSARCVMYSVDFAEIEILQAQARWQDTAKILIHAAQSLEQAGADLIILCTNTMHKLACEIELSIGIPLLHSADATAVAIKAHHLKRVGLLGTRFTMEQDFYRGRLVDRYNLEIIIPDESERALIHDIIDDELCLGVISMASKQQYLRIIHRLVEHGAEGIILGCTEIELLVKQADVNIQLFPTASIHARAAVERALEDEVRERGLQMM